jgi:hypothetical protein|tara:strand:+ start:1285 stop:1617 length:333 start_codon:yes stop_codon:yes gene_type:complete
MFSEETMQQLFVERIFKIDGQNVACRFYRPTQDGTDFSCRYTINLLGKPKERHSYGVDAIQALLLAMKKAHIELLLLRDQKGLRVEWLNEENLGLPLDEEFRDLSSKNSY